MSTVVTNTLDSGLGSLRQAIINANNNAGPDTITFVGVSGIIQLASALPNIAGDLTIEGPGADVLTIRGEGAVDPYCIFTVDSGITFNVSGLTITNGNADGGGILVSQDATVTVDRMVITNNTAAVGAV